MHAVPAGDTSDIWSLEEDNGGGEEPEGEDSHQVQLYQYQMLPVKFVSRWMKGKCSEAVCAKCCLLCSSLRKPLLFLRTHVSTLTAGTGASSSSGATRL